MVADSYKENFWADIQQLAKEAGFADCGCARALPLAGSLDECRYMEAEQLGHFGNMEYLKRNIDKRMNPALLLEGAKSIIVFLVPFGQKKYAKEQQTQQTTLKVSEFAFGLDYHIIIKEKLNAIASYIEDQIDSAVEPAATDNQSEPTNSRKRKLRHCRALIEPAATDNQSEPTNSRKRKLRHCGALIEPAATDNPSEPANSRKRKLRHCRVFTDSAPVMERAWAVRAGLGFIGKNNFFISPKAGIKNFIGIIITTAELPYHDKIMENACGSCTKCLSACTQKALYAPYKIDASRCLSYKTIEAPLPKHSSIYTYTTAPSENTENQECTKNAGKWIFGCDDCMNACPWNSFNKDGWPEFSYNQNKLQQLTTEKWLNMSQEEFEADYKNTPLTRAGLEKIKNNISL